MRLSRLGLGGAGLRTRAAVILIGLVVLATAALRLDMRSRATSNATKMSHEQVLASYGHLPLIFEANQGQSDPAVRFLARGVGYDLFLTNNEAVLTLQHPAGKSERSSVVRMGLAGSRANLDVIGANVLPGKSNYFIGNDPAKWHRNVPQFARVRYAGVYPGVDLVYYGKQGTLEYDFEVAPGASSKQIALQLSGAKNLKLAGNGDLQLDVDGSELRLLAPRIYQNFGDEKREIAGRFELRANNQVGFALGEYDHNRELIIDPVLTYSTYLGGPGDESCSAITGLAQTPGCPAIAVDAAANAYVTGSTNSPTFPGVNTSSFQQTLAAGATANAYVAKFSAAGSALVYATYLGGDGLDYTAGIAVDSAGFAYVAGTTTSTNFPTSTGPNEVAPFQQTPVSPGTHAFLSKLDGSGSSLPYSTYLSGNGTDIASGIALDTSAKAYVAGTTTSDETGSNVFFPATVGSYQPASNNPGKGQFFLTKLDTTVPGTNGVLYSTYYGGNVPSAGVVIGGAVAVDASSNAYVAGTTNYTNMSTLDAYQSTNNGGYDAFLFKINPAAVTGSQRIYASYFGEPGDDYAYSVAVDSGSNAYMTGSTTSTNFAIPTNTVRFRTAMVVESMPT